MRIKTILSVLIIFSLVTSCKKKDAKKDDKEYFFSFRVDISKRILEPTIISGFYGHVMEYTGDFKPNTTGEVKKPAPVQNKVLLYLAENKEALDDAAYQEEGQLFYDLRKLKKKNVLAKYIIIPNKDGFYQFDLGDQEYYAIVEIKRSKGYFKGGTKLLKGTVSTLEELDIRIDYNASF
jgi:hypothetical protein